MENRLFFMANFEGFRLHNQTQGVYNVPSVAMRGGNFSQILPGTVMSRLARARGKLKERLAARIGKQK